MKTITMKMGQLLLLGFLILSCRDTSNESAIQPGTQLTKTPVSADALAGDENYQALQQLSQEFATSVKTAIGNLSNEEINRLKVAGDYDKAALTFVKNNKLANYAYYQDALSARLTKLASTYSFADQSQAALSTVVEEANQIITRNTPATSSQSRSSGSGSGSGGVNGGGDSSGAHDDDPPQNYDEGNAEPGPGEEHGFASRGYSICLGTASIGFLGAIYICDQTTSSGTDERNTCYKIAGASYVIAIAACTYQAAMGGF